jgi:hypothetical protein
MSYNFIYPLVRINPEYKFNEVLSGYNYNFSIIETSLTSGSTTPSNGISFISGQTIGLGGNLTQDTHISNDNHLFSIDYLSGLSISANTINLSSLPITSGITNVLVIDNNGDVSVQSFSGDTGIILDGGFW